MKAFYYLVAALLALYVVMQMIFDTWIYRATKNFDLVLDVWFNRHKNIFGEFTANQNLFRKWLRWIERVAIASAVFVFLIELLRLVLNQQ